jgi:hypothetical protein
MEGRVLDDKARLVRKIRHDLLNGWIEGLARLAGRIEEFHDRHRRILWADDR